MMTQEVKSLEVIKRNGLWFVVNQDGQPVSRGFPMQASALRSQPAITVARALRALPPRSVNLAIRTLPAGYGVRKIGKVHVGVNPAGEVFTREYVSLDCLLTLIDKAAARKPKDKTVRPCLCCATPFESKGKANRLCPDCSGRVSRMDPRMI